MQTILNLMKQRQSCRNYLDKDVPETKINYCLEAVRYAPSACNRQPWKFIVVKNRQTRELICRKAPLPGLPMSWLKQAPVIVALCSEKSFFTHNFAAGISGIDYHLIDAGIAGEHFVLAASEQGLGTCWIGWFKEKQVKNILNIPKRIKVVSLISLGYPAKEDTGSPDKKPVEKFSSYVL
jgi:nitroreductase